MATRSRAGAAASPSASSGRGPGGFAVEVSEDDLDGVQTLSVADDGDGGSLRTIELDYKLARPGPCAGLTDVLFIRRALSASARAHARSSSPPRRRSE